MLQMARIAIGGVLLIFVLAGFFNSFWRRAPDADNTSRSDWAVLSGGGAPVERQDHSDQQGEA
jgi:hypothetical protein